MLLFWRKNGGICREAEEGCYGAQVTLQNRSLAASDVRQSDVLKGGFHFSVRRKILLDT